MADKKKPIHIQLELKVSGIIEFCENNYIHVVFDGRNKYDCFTSFGFVARGKTFWESLCKGIKAHNRIESQSA